MKKYYFLCILLLGVFFSCAEENISSEDEVLTDKPVLKKGGDGLYDLLGYAYDITGPLLENDNASDVPIIDVKKFANENPGKIDDPTSSKGDRIFYYGANSYDYLKDVTTKISGTAGITGLKIGNNNIFTATVTANKDYQTQYSYSTKYSFASCDNYIQIKRIRFIQDVDINMLIKYLTPDFIANVKSMSSEALVIRYGTHVLLDISIGGRMNFMYSSAIENETNYEKKVTGVKGGITASLQKIGLNFSTDMSKEEITKTSIENKEQKLVLRYRGGQNSGTSQTFDLNGGVVTTINDGEWVKSVTPFNAALIGIQKAYPIYDFISDPIKKKQVKTAVDNYIASKQINLLDIGTPFQRYWDGKDHFYEAGNVNYGNGRTFERTECYVFSTQKPGTIPLRRYWNGKDHYYEAGDIQDRGVWKYQFIAGYVYTTPVAGTVPLRRYWNGHDHYYEAGDIQDRGAWKYECIAAYVYR